MRHTMVAWLVLPTVHAACVSIIKGPPAGAYVSASSKTEAFVRAG